MLKLKNITLKRDEQFIFENLDITINDGINCLVAPNGTGKTTLFRVIYSLILSDSGQVEQHFENHEKVVPFKMSSFYYESTEWLNGDLSGLDYLRMIGRAWKTEKDRIEDCITFWNLEGFVRKPIKKYSLGMRQKIILAMYYVSDAKYWFLDEPMIGLDSESQYLFIEFLKCAKRDGRTVLYSTHNLEFLEEINDQVIVLVNPGN